MDIHYVNEEDHPELFRVCHNESCEDHNGETFIAEGGLLIEPSSNHCELFMDVTECEDFKENPDDRIPYHSKCGLPVELCKCPDAPVKYNEETGKFEPNINTDEARKQMDEEHESGERI